MKPKHILLIFVSYCLLSCGSSKSVATPEQIQALDLLVSEKSFKIELEAALPQVTTSLMAVQNSGLLRPGDNMSRISLLGNSNDLVIKNEHVTSNLPYYGERQMSSGYNGSDSNIEFDGPVENYKVTKRDDSSYKIEFDAMSHNENFDVTIYVFPSLKSEIVLNSAKRNTIRYEGRVIMISE